MQKLLRHTLAGALALSLAIALGACGDAENRNDNMTGTAEVMPGSSGATSPETPPQAGESDQ